MTIRKTGAVTGRIIGVEGADPEPEPTSGEELDPEDTLAGRPPQTRPAPAGDDD
jgi:hypothetical protein